MSFLETIEDFATGGDGSFDAEDAENLANTAEAVGGMFAGQSGSSSGSTSGSSSGSSSTATGALTDTGTCTPQTVAVEIGAGMRSPRTGERNESGKAEGLPKCDETTRRRGVEMYEARNNNAPSSLGDAGGPPAPPPSNTAGSGGSASGGDMIAYPDGSGLPAAELPSTLDLDLPSGWVGWVVGIGKFLVRKLGKGGANSALAALAGTLGRRINENSIPPAMADRLIDELPEPWQDVIAMWQAGVDQPYGASKEGQRLWLALQIATSSFDLQTQTHCKCTRG